jgi:hypothetical protein
MNASRAIAASGMVALGAILVSPSACSTGGACSNDTGCSVGQSCVSGTCTPNGTMQNGVAVPLALAKNGPSAELTVNLTFASKADADSTKYLALFYVNDANPAGYCGNVWSQALGLSDPSRLNFDVYPWVPNTVTIAPALGAMSLFVYTFADRPTGACLQDSDCALGGGPAGPNGTHTCVAGGAGLGICDPTAMQLPSSGGCSVITLVDGMASNVAVTLTARPAM